MPTSYIKKLSKELNKSIPSLEKVWDAAKAQAKNEKQGENFAYIIKIFQNMLGLTAASRLRKTEDL